MEGQGMTDYGELVKALTCGNDGKLPCHNNECPYWVDKWHGIGLCNVIKKDADAADAIEELDAEETRLLLITSELQDKVVELEEELNDADIAADDNGWQVEELQAEVERLQAQLPKLGEWQKAKPKGVVTYSDGYAECSHCHETIWLGWGMNFCPHCGTQNKIIDPDDYDGAKMEVQDG